MKPGDRIYLRKLTEILPQHDGRLIIELLDETEPTAEPVPGWEWRVAQDGIVAHYVNAFMWPVCGARSQTAWRVVTNAPPCRDCEHIIESGVAS
jgi:hypothetical protein